MGDTVLYIYIYICIYTHRKYKEESNQGCHANKHVCVYRRKHMRDSGLQVLSLIPSHVGCLSHTCHGFSCKPEFRA